MEPLNYSSVQEFAVITGISATQAYRLIKNKIIPAKQIGTKIVILEKDVEHYIDNLPDYELSPHKDTEVYHVG